MGEEGGREARVGKKGSGVRDIAPLSLGNVRAKSSELHSLILRPILRKSAAVIFTLSNNFTWSSRFPFQKAKPVK